MGRTQRRRRHSRSRNFHTCDDEKELILLNSWLAGQGMRYNKKLVLAVFDDTGRGVLTKKKIYAGEELMNLPLSSTINVTTILMDTDFCTLFLDNSKQCLVEYKKKVSFQSLMALYLVYLKLQGSSNKWFVYLESLPKEYTVPYFLPNNLKCLIDSNLITVIEKQKDIIDTSFHIFEDILKCNENKKNICSVKSLIENFKLCEYEWAYFTVNTRCVYMDLSRVVDLENVDNSILSLINDSMKISLCPYLDMINHSPNAKNETKLMVSKNIIENVSVNKLNTELFTEISFSIYTKNNFDPYTQVFICYGDSHNSKLITEYGFFLSDNELDYVSFNFEDVLHYLSTKSIKLSQDQLSFINSHGLNKDLYIDIRGMSFNLYGLLMVVKYYYDRTTDVSRLIYSAAICSDDRLLIELITPMVNEKLTNIEESIRELRSYNSECIILNNCVALMCQYISILEKFIKC